MDKLVELETLCVDLPAARDREGRGRLLATALNRLRRLDASIERMEAWATVKGQKTPPFALSELPPEKPVRRLLTIAEELSTLAARGQLERFAGRWQELETLLTDALESGTAAWRDTLGRRFGWCVELGATLKQLPPTRKLGEELCSIGAKASQLQEFPPSGRALKECIALAAKAEEQRRALSSLGIGEGVERFLDALSRRSATLALVDQSTLLWLAQHSLADKLSVSIERR